MKYAYKKEQQAGEFHTVAAWLMRHFHWHCFKNRIDTFFSDQGILCDYNADLHGIGNRSIVQ